MAQHPSLRSKEKQKKHRSVLKRYERVKELKEKEKWKEGDSVFGLPKLKILKFKLKKEKIAPTAAEETQVQVGEGASEGAQGAEKAKEAKKESAIKPALEKKETAKKEEKKR